MRRDVKRRYCFIAGAVGCDEPNESAGLIEQQSAAVCADRKRSRTVFAVYFDDFLPRLRLIASVWSQKRIYHRIIQRIFVHFRAPFTDLIVLKNEPPRKDARRLF